MREFENYGAWGLVIFFICLDEIDRISRRTKKGPGGESVFSFLLRQIKGPPMEREL